MENKSEEPSFFEGLCLTRKVLFIMGGLNGAYVHSKEDGIDFFASLIYSTRPVFIA